MKKFTGQIMLFAGSCILVLSMPLYVMFWINPHFNEIITFEKEVNAKQIARHITKMLNLGVIDTSLSSDNVTDKFTRVLTEAQTDFDLTKIKVFSAQGKVIYSTDAQEIGTINSRP